MLRSSKHRRCYAAPVQLARARALSRRHRALTKMCSFRADLVQDWSRNVENGKATKTGQLLVCLGNLFVFSLAPGGAE